MTYQIETQSELIGLAKLLSLILDNGKLNGRYVEISPCLLSMNYNETKWEEYKNFKEAYLKITNKIGSRGILKATRVFETLKNTSSKPSYLSRLTEYRDYSYKNKESFYVNQIETIAKQLSLNPGYSCLSFVLLRPTDLIDKVRPGYVPCIIGGDLKFRDKKLTMNVMLRSFDSLGSGYADIFYLRNLQRDILEKARII